MQPAVHEKLCHEYKIDDIKEAIKKYSDFLNGPKESDENQVPKTTQIVLYELFNVDYTYETSKAAEAMLFELLNIAYADELSLVSKLGLQYNLKRTKREPLDAEIDNKRKCVVPEF